MVTTAKPPQQRSHGFALILCVIVAVVIAVGAIRMVGGSPEPASPPAATQSASQPIQITVGFTPIGKVNWTGSWQIGAVKGRISHDSQANWQTTRNAKVGDYVNLQVNPPASYPPTTYLYCFILKGVQGVPVRTNNLERREVSCNLTYVVEAS